MSEIVAVARRHYEAQRGKGAGVKSNGIESRWTAWAATMAEAIGALQDPTAVLHYAQKELPFDHRVRAEDFQVNAEAFDYLTFAEFPWHMDAIKQLGDNPASRPDSLLRRDGRILSNIFYWHLRPLLVCQTHVTEPKRILEIGGGYGGMCRLWLHNRIGPPERYVIVDLPESLFFAEVCLRQEFGDAVGYFDGVDPGAKVLLVPIGELGNFHDRIDVALSVGSLQEMCDEWVSFYMDWLDRCGARFFYSMNYMGQPCRDLYEGRSLWAVRPSPEWTLRLLTPDPPLVKIMSVHRHFAEMLFERRHSEATLDDWSVARGACLTRATWLEGLDHLRADLSQPNALRFLRLLATRKASINAPIELLYIAKRAGVRLQHSVSMKVTP